MAKKVYAVVGATGQIGRVVVEQLLKKGDQVKAIGRNKQKLDFLKSKGAESILIDNFEKAEFLAEAFKGVDAVFGMIPPGYGVENYSTYQDRVGEAIKSAIQKNAVRYLVNLSSIGAYLPEGTGLIKGLYRQEERLNSIPDLNVLHLRAGYFMENFLLYIPVIQQTGALKATLKPDLPLPMVSTEDIGLKAAEFLGSLNFKGKTAFEFFGPRLQNIKEATQILGNAIGKNDLKYTQISYEEGKKEMLAMGMKPSLVDLMLEMYRAFNEEKISFTQKITSDHQGKITFEQFAKNFAKNYKEYSEKQKVKA